MSDNPFKPLPAGNEGDWLAIEHQRAANFYYYEYMRCLDADYREANPNYKPYETGMKSAWARHTRYAKAKRAQEARA